MRVDVWETLLGAPGFRVPFFFCLFFSSTSARSTDCADSARFRRVGAFEEELVVFSAAVVESFEFGVIARSRI